MIPNAMLHTSAFFKDNFRIEIFSVRKTTINKVVILSAF